MICDRVALTCEAVQFTGNPKPVETFIGAPLVSEYGRYVLQNPRGTIWLFLDHGDWIVRGVGSEWDFYVVADRKFRQLWKPRETD